MHCVQGVLQVCKCPPVCSIAGVGFTSGLVGVLDTLTLEDVCEPFRYARDCITHVVFSHDSMYMATAVSSIHSTHCRETRLFISSQDLDLCVTVYIAWPGRVDQQPWQFLAKHKAHYKKIESEHSRMTNSV